MRQKHYCVVSYALCRCLCPTCRQGKGLSRSLLHSTFSKVTATASSLTLHNLAFQAKLMKGARDAIVQDSFPDYLRAFFKRYYKGHSNFPCACPFPMSALHVLTMCFTQRMGSGCIAISGHGFDVRCASGHNTQDRRCTDVGLCLMCERLKGRCITVGGYKTLRSISFRPSSLKTQAGSNDGLSKPA